MSDKDEPKGTPEDESKRNSKDESKGTPKDKGKLYTQAAIDKIKSDSAAMGQGRAELKANQEKEALTQELESTKSRLDALEREQDESRRAEASGDSDALKALNREQAVKKRERQADDRERDLTRREGQVKADREEVDKDKGVVSTAYLAAKHGLKVEDLEELGDLSPEALEKVAVKLAAAKPKGEGGEGGEGDESLKLDTGEGSGSGEPTEQQKLDARYPTMAKTK